MGKLLPWACTQSDVEYCSGFLTRVSIVRVTICQRNVPFQLRKLNYLYSAIARKGFARMAITGSIAGPLFNLFFGLGLSLIKSNISGNEDNTFSFTSNDCILPTVAGACLFGGLTLMFFSAILQRFVLRKCMGIIMIAYYILSLILLSILAFVIN